MNRKAKPSLDKIVAKAFREKLPRKRRAKSEADVWFEGMKKDFVAHGAEHLKSARTKLTSPLVTHIEIVEVPTSSLAGCDNPLQAAADRARKDLDLPSWNFNARFAGAPLGQMGLNREIVLLDVPAKKLLKS